MSKKCWSCKQTKTYSYFPKSKCVKDGYGDTCKKCAAKYYAKNKKKILAKNKLRRQELLAWLAEYKTNLSCECCGEKHPAIIDFHHKNPKEKDFQISYAVKLGYTKIKILEEIAKCNIWCSNCHRKFHWSERNV